MSYLYYIVTYLFKLIDLDFNYLILSNNILQL